MNDNRLRWVKSFWKVVLKIGNICFVAQSFLELRLCRRYTCNILRSCAICLANSGTNTVHIISHYLPLIGNSYGRFLRAPKLWEQKAVFPSFAFYLHLYAAFWRYKNQTFFSLSFFNDCLWERLQKLVWLAVSYIGVLWFSYFVLCLLSQRLNDKTTNTHARMQTQWYWLALFFSYLLCPSMQCVLSHRVINRLTQTHASKRLFVQHIQHWPQMIFINHGTGFFLFIGIHVVRLICCWNC